MKEVKTEKSPKALGPYSQAIESEKLIFCSGQIGIIPNNGELVSQEIVGQTKQAIDNLKQILIAAGSNLDSVLRTEVFLKNMSDFAAMNEVYEKKFSIMPKPARVTVEVAKLPKDALIEISCIAYKKSL